MKIEMAEDAQALDEVVIVGFGSMNKKHITGSMTSVDSKILEEKNSVNVFDALQGAAPRYANRIKLRSAWFFFICIYPWCFYFLVMKVSLRCML